MPRLWSELDEKSEAGHEPTAHCEVCAWQSTCDARRRQDDHISLVAGISKVQRTELGSHGIETVAALSTLALPLRPVGSLRASMQQSSLHFANSTKVRWAFASLAAELPPEILKVYR